MAEEHAAPSSSPSASMHGDRRENEAQAPSASHVEEKRLANISRLRAFYWAHDPRKVDHVEELLSQHPGREELFLQRVHREFGVRDFSGEEAIDDIYEHQRYSYLSFSWGSTFPGHLLPTDRHQWSGLHGSPSSQKRGKVEPQLPVNWRWTNDWTVDTTSCNCDAEGWVYALDFTRINYLVQKGEERSEPNATDYVRRRRWIHTRRREIENVPVASLPLPKSVEKPDTNSDEQWFVDDTEAPSGDEGENYLVDKNEGRISEAPNGGRVSAPQAEVRARCTEAGAVNSPGVAPSSAKQSNPASHTELAFFSMGMDKFAIDTAWKAAVKDLEAVYTRAKAQQATKKQKWSVKKEKIRRQIHLLEKTIVSMQAVAAEEEKKRKIGSPKPPPRPQTVAPPSPTSRSPPNETSTDSPTNAVNLAAKMQCAQSKLDALRRFYWHPRESNYTLRFSIDGIFYGLRDFFVESFRSSFSLQISHQTNGAQGITPTCKISMKGHTVCCGKHVKVVGEKGTRIPKSIWDSMYMDTDFEVSIFLIYVEDLDDPSSMAQGSWEFLFAPEATNVELFNFTRRVKGGMDLPETVVRKLCSDVLSSLVRDLTLLYFPYELALAFKLPPAKLDLQGTIQITGPSIDDVMEKELEEMDVAAIREAEAKEKLRRQAKEEAAGRRDEEGEAHPLAKPLLDAAAVAVQVFSLLLSDSDKHMRTIAKLLQLSPAQMNLLVALKASGLFPPTHSFRCVASICAYYNAFSNGDPSLESKAGGVHDEQSQKLRATWRRVLELIFIRKMQAAGTTGKGQPQKEKFSVEAEASCDIEDAPQFELFDMDAFFDNIGRLTKKPAAIQLSVKHFHCTLNALNVVEALSMLYERVVLGIDYGKPRTGADGFLYGFRFGRKASLQAAVAAAAAAAASTAVKASGQVQSVARSPVLNPRRYRPREMTFRTCEEEFGKFWRSLKAIIAFVRDNIDDVSTDVAGNVKGTGDDCVINGSFKDAAFRGPLNMALAVPPCFLGFYRAETISLGNDRVGLQLDAMLPSVAMAPKTTNQSAKPLESIGRIMLADLTSEILIDLDALIAHEEQRREQLAAARKAHGASGSAEKNHLGEVSETNKPTKHRALAISFGPKTVGNGTDGDENTTNLTALPSRASGQLSVATSVFTKLHTTAKGGSFMMRLLPLVDWLLTRYVRPYVVQSFSQHQVLFDTAQASMLQLLRSPKLELDFDVLARAFIHDDQSLMVSVCGSPLHPTPMVYKDEVNLLDIILQVDDLVNIWIDDRYPPYSNPLYF